MANQSKIELLNNQNCHNWSYAQQMELTKKKVWSVVNGDEPKPLGSPNHVTVKAWVKKDEEALAVIVSNIEPSQYHLTRTASTSKMAWDNIIAYHMASGLQSVVAMWRGLAKVKKADIFTDGETMRDRIGTIQDTAIKLQSLGEEVSPRFIVATILESCPPTFEPLIISLDSHPNQSDLSYIISRVLNEEKRQQEEAAQAGLHAQALATFAGGPRPLPNRSNITCHGCGQKGHFKNECGTFPFNLVPSAAPVHPSANAIDIAPSAASSVSTPGNVYIMATATDEDDDVTDHRLPF